MRTLALVFTFGAATLAWSPPVRAQVTDAERAAARDLFKQGDELQRAGKYAEALDKFNRAQQVFSAPTNMLRIAECEAALGRLVESAESYRAVVRTPLPAGSPPAFQAAVDQAKGELSQIEPRVPKLVVQVEPGNVPNEQMQIDGQNVPAALIGEPMPLDPGQHKVLVFAPGYASAEQPVTLKEHDTKTLSITLRPISGVTYAPGSPGGSPPGAGQPAPPPSDGAATAAPGAIPPPPPPIQDATANQAAAAAAAAAKKSRTGFILGLHLGLEIPGGSAPLPTTATGPSTVGMGDVSGNGVAYAFDGGLRFARSWYLGMTLEHAGLGANKDAGTKLGGTNVNSDTSALGLVLGLIVNPDKVSFFGEVGVQERWYGFSYFDGNGQKQSNSYSSGEVLLGAGIWVPIGRSVRLLPEATLALGTFNPPDQSGTSSNSTGSTGHLFFMLGVGGFYNIDL
jgi:hypothetical protein